MIERIAERRIAPRAFAAARVFVTEPGVAGEVPGDEELLVPIFGRAVNLSETGVLVEVDEPLCIGRRLLVTLELDGGPRMTLRGRVARTTRVRGSSRFRLGLVFDPPSEEERQFLREAVREGLTESYLN